MLSLTFILFSVWALTAIGVVVLCVAVRHADEEIAGDPTAIAPRAPARVPARAFNRAVPR